MPYIGNQAGNRFVASKAASVYSGNGSTTAFTLEHAVGSDEDILVSVDGVIQEPSVAYAVSSGTTLTFTAAPSSNSGNNIFVYYLFSTLGTVTHPATSALSATSGTFTGDVAVDTDTLKVDVTNDRVGINVASPTEALNVNSGSATTATRIKSTGSSVYQRFENSGSNSGYIGYSSNLELWANNNLGLILDGTGAVTMPDQPAFSATPASQSNFAVGSAVTVTYNSELYDQNADYNNSNYTFTAPVTGKYQLNVSLLVQTLDSAANYYQTQLITSNRAYYHTVDTDYGQDNGYINLDISVLADMDAADTAVVKIIQANGAQQSDINPSGSFSGFLAC